MLSTLFVAAFTLAASTPSLVLAASGNEQQCMGEVPMDSVSNFLGMQLDYETAEWICCNNHRWAERFGYLEEPQVDLFSKLDPTTEHIFYDSVCGIPLFVAPRGRSFEEFKEESIKHGWPSFRPAEIVSENVIIHPDGRMESKCLTHLGHNLPKNGKDRYCIDLVCIAGTPVTTSPQSNNTNIKSIDDGSNIITAVDFDASSYKSSAEEWSGKYPTLKRNLIIAGIVVVVVALVAVLVGFLVKKRRCISEQAKKVIQAESKGDSGPSSPHSSDTNSSEGITQP